MKGKPKAHSWGGICPRAERRNQERNGKILDTNILATFCFGVKYDRRITAAESLK